ncbi:hypothetical protein FIBSPDRAFT_344809 [Athelia psychrophila]|uniref:Uncharacterized protein n=1 Tax=Athelia psychrophila TaxID=1759441 RepID=A0A167W3F5_9AGAM|nr:hypothetical protein FIBSPDRAFT_344809 [Fibularhizoctonia sp. CBS 109695]
MYDYRQINTWRITSCFLLCATHSDSTPLRWFPLHNARFKQPELNSNCIDISRYIQHSDVRTELCGLRLSMGFEKYLAPPVFRGCGGLGLRPGLQWRDRKQAESGFCQRTECFTCTMYLAHPRRGEEQRRKSLSHALPCATQCATQCSRAKFKPS